MKYSYNKKQLEKAVSFISTHNRSFKGKTSFIRETIIDYFKKFCHNPDVNSYATMGFILTADRLHESFDYDDDLIHIEIYVDPSLGADDYNIIEVECNDK